MSWRLGARKWRARPHAIQIVVFELGMMLLMMHFPTEYHLTKSNQLIALGDRDSLRYACVELRTCIELLCYEQLERYRELIPNAVLTKWQPREVVAWIEKCDPFGVKDKAVFFGINGPDGKPDKMEPLGRFKAVDKKFIKNHYHRLGQHLHAPNLNDIVNEHELSLPKFREEVERISIAVKEIASRDILVRMLNLARFRCNLCNIEIVVNADIHETGDVIPCLDSDCHADYKLEIDESSFKSATHYAFIWTCDACFTKQPVFERDISQMGQAVKCSGCESLWFVGTKALLYCPVNIPK